MYNEDKPKNDVVLFSHFKYFRLYWHGITFISWLLFYLSISTFQVDNNIIDLFLRTLLCVLLLGLLQAFIINKLIKVFYIWILTTLSGIIVGLTYFVTFIWTLEGLIYVTK